MTMRPILTLGFCVGVFMSAFPALADDAHIGGMQLQPGYKHRPLQGIDSIVGEIVKEDGLRIMYEIGSIPKPGGFRLGGQFSDRPKLAPKEQVRWYREHGVSQTYTHLEMKG